MVDHVAECLGCTTAWTRVSTAVIGAHLVAGAVGVQSAFWPTIRRCTRVAGLASAYGLFVVRAADRIRSARVSIARVNVTDGTF